MSPSHIVLEEFHGVHHCNQLFIGSRPTAPLLAGIRGFRGVSDNLFNNPTTFLLLCSRTVPIPVSLASVERTNGMSLVGYAKTGG